MPPLDGGIFPVNKWEGNAPFVSEERMRFPCTDGEKILLVKWQTICSSNVPVTSPSNTQSYSTGCRSRKSSLSWIIVIVHIRLFNNGNQILVKFNFRSSRIYRSKFCNNMFV